MALLAAASVAAGDEQAARTLLACDGTAVLATCEQLTPNWSIAVRTDDGTKDFARSDYVLWGDYADEDRSAQFLLLDGTMLVGDLVRIETDSITVASRLCGELQIDRRSVRAYLLLPKVGPLERDREWQSLETPHGVDRVLLLSGDALSGSLLPTTQRDDGGLFGLVSLQVDLLGGAPTTTVRMEAVRAIAFRAGEEQMAPAACFLGFRDGSYVVASKLTRGEGDLMRITTTAGTSLRIESDVFRQNVTLIQPISDAVDYLSDLPAVGYKSLPLLSLEWPLGIAANTLGGRLRTGDHVYLKGLGMHSASRVVYELQRKYRRFEAELALDDQAKVQGSVIYRVLVQRASNTGESVWQLGFTSPIVRGGDAPLAMSLDVTNATRLALIVEMADRVTTRDYANWLNARLMVDPQGPLR